MPMSTIAPTTTPARAPAHEVAYLPAARVGERRPSHD